MAEDLTKLSDDEIKELLDFEKSVAKYEEWVGQSEEIRNLENEREVSLALARSLSEYNLARKDDYEEGRTKLLLVLAECNKLKEQIQEKATRLLEISKKKSLETTLAALTTAATTAEEESENVVKSIQEPKIESVESFVSEYMEKRKLAHRRRIKADKLRQQITHEPWTGHTGIADSEGVIHDFGGSYYIAVDNFTFGQPTKYLKLDPSKVEALNWDEAVQVSANKFRQQTHNIITNNCHGHVADTLNVMRYNGKDDYTQFDVFLMMISQANYVGLKGFLKQWGFFSLLLIFIILVLVL